MENPTTMNLSLLLVLRLAFAAMLGGVIGFEREWRAKEAGLRTHFLVAMGACLFMVVSQYGFDVASVIARQDPSVASGMAVRLDVSRIASQIVTGVSFLGAGVIVLHKRFIMGLTTAATIWTTAAIGVAVGGGLYPVAAVATMLVLVGLESGRLVDRHFSRARREVRVVFTSSDDETTEKALSALRDARARIASFSREPHDRGQRIHLLLEATTAVSQPDFLLPLLSKVPGIRPETVE